MRVRHVKQTSDLVQESQKPDTTSLTGYAGGTRSLIVPEHNIETYHQIAQTQQMFARGEWRVRYIDYENAPFGRDVHATSPYRWWLGLVAWCDQLISGRPLGQAVERAALIADPLLLLLFLVGTTLFVASQFGGLTAALFSLATATLFPFSAGFLPGLTDGRGLARTWAVWTVLPLLVGIGRLYSGKNDASLQARRWFAVAGVTGGLGLWINAAIQMPVLVGIAIGSVIVAWTARRNPKTNLPAAPELPWRIWALAGATTSLVSYLLEYFPSHLGSWELHAVHPLYGIGWLGGAEVLTRVTSWIEGRKPTWRIADIAIWLLAVVGLAAAPVAMRLTHSLGFLEIDLPALRLVQLPGGASALNFFAWLSRDGATAAVIATVVPLLFIAPAIWLLVRRGTSAETRAGIALALGPVLVALGFACRQLSWWHGLDALLLVALIPVTLAVREVFKSRSVRWMLGGLTALLLLPGAVQIVPRSESTAKNVFNENEVYGLVERDLARWLAIHTRPGEAGILAPSNVASTLYFYGGLRGLGTVSWENQDGIGAAVRITSASTPEEAKELIDRRGITHVVIPSWDSYLDVYARMGMGQLEGTFLERLHLWNLPPWLRPVPYQLPVIAGFEGQSVLILEVVEDQEDAVALSRIAEYFVEMGQLDRAASVGVALRRFPADVGALVARAQVELARDDTASFGRTVEQLKSRLSGGAARALPWDRRVGLAVVFARAKHMDLAREQVRRCFAEVDDTQLRALPTGSLYRLLVLGRAFGLSIADPKLHQLALDLLPTEFRSRF